MTRTRKLRRGIYLLPTLFTIGNLFCGFSAILQASRGSYQIAAVLVFVAAVMDVLDGRIARMTGTTSDFGVQFDSLADVVSFGVAPACLTHAWALNQLGRVGWMVAFLYVVCASMRLARFNIQASSADKRFFVGLASPPAAVALAGVMYLFPQLPDSRGVAVGAAILVATIALLLISHFRYYSFKDLDLQSRLSHYWVLPFAALIVIILTEPGLMLIPATLYVLSGPAIFLWMLLRRRSGSSSETLDEPAR